jgi:hypothetical protein
MWLLFQLDGILFGFLLLSSSSVFQSAAVPGGRNSISPPSPSPVRYAQCQETAYNNETTDKTKNRKPTLRKIKRDASQHTKPTLLHHI